MARRVVQRVGGEGGLRRVRALRDAARRAERRTGECMRDLFHRLLIRIFSGGKGTFFLQFRPDFHLRAGRFGSFATASRSWMARGILPHGGDFARLYLLYLQVRYVSKSGIAGDLAEVGVYRGTTARLLHSLAPDRTLYLFDTFSGFDQRELDAEKWETGLDYSSDHFADTSLERVREFVGTDHRVVFLAGRFPETTQDVPADAVFSLVHFDADLHEPASAFCRFFYERMSPGGVMIFHDYNGGFAGVKKAVDEFFAGKPEVPVQVPDKSGSAIVIRSKNPIGGEAS